MPYSVIHKLYSAAIGIVLFLALFNVVDAATFSSDPVGSIIWFCIFAVMVAVLYWIRDGHTFKVNTGEPSYYARNRG